MATKKSTTETVKDTVKKATDAVKDAVTPKSTGDTLTATVEETEIPVVATTPFQKVSPLKVARSEARSRRALAKNESEEAPRKLSKDGLSDKGIGTLLNLIDSSDNNTSTELRGMLAALGVDENKERDIREKMKDVTFLSNAGKPSDLNVLGLPPGSVKPRGFAAAPGTPVKSEDKYWPVRFAMPPNLDNYEEGDLLYNIHEDKTFTVLSEMQQTPEWQNANTLPPMNLLERVGGGEADEVPEEVERKQAQM